MRAVCTIIPIFNAYPELRACIESVLVHTKDHTDHRIILIDDKSTDPRIASLLQNLEEHYCSRVTVLRNEENLGFVQTVNHGLAHTSQEDVILLNTDTCIYAGFLEGLKRAAYSAQNIASVTPLSNNASVYSVCTKEVALLTASQRGELAAYVQKRSPKYPRIPTGVGFCLYMRREALDAVGILDTIFGRGYGEENDWCQRARSKGFVHVLDDATFVYHKGHVSMIASGDLQPGQHSNDEHEAIIQTRYPRYTKDIKRFVRSTVMPALQAELTLIARNMIGSHRKRIVLHLHNAIYKGVIGGTELYVERLVSVLRHTYDCFVTSPKNNEICIQQFCEHREAEWTVGSMDELCKTYTIDLAHIHHTLGTGFTVIDTMKQHGIPVVFTMHDMHAVHPVPHIVAHEDDTCVLDPSDPMLMKYRSAVDTSLRQVDVCIAPTLSPLTYLRETYPNLTDTQHVIEHGMPARAVEMPTSLDRRHICFLGHSSAASKGGKKATAIANALINLGFRVTFIGEAYRDTDTDTRIEQLGPYAQPHLSALLAGLRPGLICIASLWPETYSYTLSEAWQSGIPACTGMEGGIAERMQHHGAGICIDLSKDPAACAADIAAFMQSDAYNAAYTNAKETELPSIEDATTPIIDIYEELFAKTDAHITTKKPNTLIIGAQKSGTSWLQEMLSKHPDVYMASKETEFFSYTHDRKAMGLTHYCRRHFSDADAQTIRCEKTAGYFWVSDEYPEWNPPPSRQETPEAIATTLGPDARYLLSLRDPVERALSAYCHHITHSGLMHTEGSFMENALRYGIIHMGFYAAHLRLWMKHIPRDALQVLIFEEDICMHPVETLRSIHQFLGIADDIASPIHHSQPVYEGLQREYHTDGSVSVKGIGMLITAEERMQLEALYLQDITELTQILERDLSCWTSLYAHPSSIHTSEKSLSHAR